MIGRCETCAWWSEGLAELDQFHGACERAEANDDRWPVHPPTKALAYGSVDDWGAGPAFLLTSRDFGCVQWEPKGSNDLAG